MEHILTECMFNDNIQFRKWQLKANRESRLDCNQAGINKAERIKQHYISPSETEFRRRDWTCTASSNRFNRTTFIALC